MTEWTDCQFLRPLGSRACVVRLETSGAILQIALQDPVDITKACLACPTKPVPARVRLAEDLERGHSELEIEWPADRLPPSMAIMPPPNRFIRKSRAPPRKTKRQRHG
jgi:hypothetical protein